jgi:hypothetical protein
MTIPQTFSPDIIAKLHWEVHEAQMTLEKWKPTLTKIYGTENRNISLFLEIINLMKAFHMNHDPFENQKPKLKTQFVPMSLEDSRQCCEEMQNAASAFHYWKCKFEQRNGYPMGEDFLLAKTLAMADACCKIAEKDYEIAVREDEMKKRKEMIEKEKSKMSSTCNEEFYEALCDASGTLRYWLDNYRGQVQSIMGNDYLLEKTTDMLDSCCAIAKKDYELFSLKKKVNDYQVRNEEIEEGF